VTAFFDLFDDPFQRVILRQREQGMDVIFDSANHQRRTLPFLKDPCLIRKQSVAVLLGNPSLTVLRAVHEMKQVFHKGLGHVVSLQYVSPFQG